MTPVVSGPDPSERYTPIPKEYLYALNMSRKARTAQEGQARNLRPGALTTCPKCLYDMSDSLDGDEPRRCPECGEMVSRLSNAAIWGNRGYEARWARLFTFWSGCVAGVLIWLAATVHYLATDIALGVALTLIFYAPVLAVCILVIVPVFTAIWLKARNPLSPTAMRATLAFVNLLVQLVVFALMLYVLIAVSRAL